MFCPECGEVIGSGPLDMRRACHAESVTDAPHPPLLRRIGSALRRLTGLGIRPGASGDHGGA